MIKDVMDFLKWEFMLKKLLSILIIFSFFVSDCAWCIKPKSSDRVEDSEKHSLFPRTAPVPIDRTPGDSRQPSSLSLREMSILGITMASSAETQSLLSDSSPGSLSIHMRDETESEGEEESDFNSLEPSFEERKEASPYGSIQDHPLSRDNQGAPPSDQPKEFVIHPFLRLSTLDVEDIPSLSPALLELVNTMRDLQEGDPAQQRTARFLTETYDPLVKGFLKNRQLIIGGLGGLAISSGVLFATIWLYADLITRFSELKGLSANILTSLYYRDVIFDYAQWVLFADAGIRNAKTLTQLITPSFAMFEKNKTLAQKVFFKGLDLIVYGASCPAGLLLSYALSKTMFNNLMIADNLSKSAFFIAFALMAPALFADEVLYFGSRLSTLCKRKFSNLFNYQKDGKGLQAEKFRTGLREEFIALKHLFLSLPEASLSQAFRDILATPSALSRHDEPSNLLRGVENLRTLQALHRYAENNLEDLPHPHKHNMLHHLKKIPAWGLPLLATWGRSVIFYYIINDVLEDVGITNDPLRMTLSIVVGGQIASLIQFKFEIDGVMHTLNKIFGEEASSKEVSLSFKQRVLSTFITLHSYFCGLWMTAPYMIIGAYTSQGWSLGTRLACFIPAGLTAVLGNSMMVEETSRDLSDFLKILDLTSHPNLTSQQRRNLVTLVERYHNFFENLDPEILVRLRPFLTQRNSSSPSQARGYLDERGFLFIPRFLNHVSQLDESQESIDQRTSRFLNYAHAFLVENKKTWKQALITGAASTVSTAINDGVIAVNIFPVTSPYPTLYLITDPLLYNYFLVPLTILDTFSRNSQVISSSLSPSTVEFEIPQRRYQRIIHVLKEITSYGTACLPSLVPIVCYGRELLLLERQGGREGLLFDYGITVPFIFLNFLTFYGPHLSRYVETLPKWFTSPRHSLGSPAEQMRGRVLREFKNLKWWIARLEEEDIHELYGNVLEPSTADMPAIDQDREQYEAAKALRTLWVLRQYAQHNKDMMPDPESEIARKALSRTMGWVIPLIASGGRTFIYWYMFYHLFEFLGLEDDAANMALSVVLGGAGSLFQGLVECEATEKAVYDCTGGKKIGKDASHSLKRKALRMGGKLHNFVMGGVYSIPFMGIGLLATEDWVLWQRLCLLIPTAFSDTLKNAMMLNESIGRAAQFIDNTAAKFTSPSADQKRNQLVALTRRYRQMLKRLHPDILLRVESLLTQIEPEPSPACSVMTPRK